MYTEQNLSHSHFVHHKSRMDWASCNGAHITTQKTIILIHTAIRTSDHKYYGGEFRRLEKQGKIKYCVCMMHYIFKIDNINRDVRSCTPTLRQSLIPVVHISRALRVTDTCLLPEETQPQKHSVSFHLYSGKYQTE
jgi:hypothetical protein